MAINEKPWKQWTSQKINETLVKLHEKPHEHQLTRMRNLWKSMKINNKAVTIKINENSMKINEQQRQIDERR